MGQKRDELLTMLENDNPVPSLSYWSSLLNFAEKYKNELTISDMEAICSESERARAYYNVDRKYKTKIFRNGKEMEMDMFKPSLEIEKESVFPNVYQILDEKIEEERIELIREEREKTKTYTKEESKIDIPLPLAAAPL